MTTEQIMATAQHNQFLYFFSTLPQFLAAFLGLSIVFYFFFNESYKKIIVLEGNNLLKYFERLKYSDELKLHVNAIKMSTEAAFSKVILKKAILIKRDFEHELSGDDMITKNIRKRLEFLDKYNDLKNRLRCAVFVGIFSGLIASIWSLITLLYIVSMTACCLSYTKFSILALTILSISSIAYMTVQALLKGD